MRRAVQRRQLPGGLGTNPRLANVGYPIVDAVPDGTFEITKHPGTGGRISVAGVKEQLVYEMGNPRSTSRPMASRISPRFGSSRGEGQSSGVGVRGRPATDKLKVSIGYFYGYKAVGTLVTCGRMPTGRLRPRTGFSASGSPISVSRSSRC